MADFMSYQNTFRKFVLDVYDEQIKAQNKFPEGKNLLAALIEEVGESAQALLKIQESNESPENVYKELVQVASTAYRLAILGDMTYGYKGTKCCYGGCTQVTLGGPCALCYE